MTATASPPTRVDLLNDLALAEALATMAGFARLSNDEVRAMRARRRRALGSVGALALVLAIGLGRWWDGSGAITSHYQTARGQQLAVALVDGTRIRLNGATSLDVTFASAQRHVTLAQGEAYFDVSHDAKRPFAVEIGGVTARVLGTAFDLERTNGQVELGVYRGAVRFADTGSPSSGVVVRAGWRSRYRDGTVGSPTRFDPAQQDWRQGWLDTEGMRLGDLVDALNRGGGPLVVAPPPALAALPIGGRFKLDDPGQLLAAIGAAYGFSVVPEGDRLRLRAISD